MSISLLLYYLGRFLLGFLLVVVIFLLAAWLLPKIKVGKNTTAVIDRTKTVYLHGNGVHVDLIFAKGDIPADFLAQLNPISGKKYLAFGWGDRGFYLETPTWAELKPSVAFRAAFLPSASLMHVVQHATTGPDWRAIPVTPAQLNSLLQHIKLGFYEVSKKEELKAIPDAGYTDNDHFYRGTGSYFCTYTCNTWINEGLKKVGIPTALWTIHEDGILNHFPLDKPGVPLKTTNQ